MDFNIHVTFRVIILINFAGFLVTVKCDCHALIPGNSAILANHERLESPFMWEIFTDKNLVDEFY